MQYMLLIYMNEAMRPSGAELAKWVQEYGAFTQDIVKAGKFKAGDRLEPTTTATTVRVRDRQDANHRWTFRGNQGTTGRVLSRRGEGPGRGDRDRRTNSRCALRLDRSASGRDG